MATRLELLRQKFRGIEEQIEEQRKRIPPHSVKPAAIMELEAQMTASLTNIFRVFVAP